MEPLEPVTGRPEYSPGHTGTNEVYIYQKIGARECLCTTQRVKEEEGRGTEPSGSLNGEGYNGSVYEGCWSVDSSVVQALGLFAPGGGSVPSQVGGGGRGWESFGTPIQQSRR